MFQIISGRVSWKSMSSIGFDAQIKSVRCQRAFLFRTVIASVLASMKIISQNRIITL
jgi:hypothetical protein